MTKIFLIMASAKHLFFNFVGGMAFIGLSLVAGGCSKGASASGDFPSDFNRLPDGEKVAYVMKNATPDSVARFICDAGLGRVKGVTINAFGDATLYAYENYTSGDIEKFSTEYERYIDVQPLPDKMRLYVLGGKEDPQKLGYMLGLDYVRSIREKHFTADQVEAELKEFKKACGSDTETYRRFIVGFRTVLELDRGKDLPEDIYKKFINYE